MAEKLQDKVEKEVARVIPAIERFAATVRTTSAELSTRYVATMKEVLPVFRRPR